MLKKFFFVTLAFMACTAMNPTLMKAYDSAAVRAEKELKQLSRKGTFPWIRSEDCFFNTKLFTYPTTDTIPENIVIGITKDSFTPVIESIAKAINKEFKKQYPSTKFTFKDYSNADTLFQALESKEIDIGFPSFSVPTTSPKNVISGCSTLAFVVKFYTKNEEIKDLDSLILYSEKHYLKIAAGEKGECNFVKSFFNADCAEQDKELSADFLDENPDFDLAFARNIFDETSATLIDGRVSVPISPFFYYNPELQEVDKDHQHLTGNSQVQQMINAALSEYISRKEFNEWRELDNILVNGDCLFHHASYPEKSKLVGTAKAILEEKRIQFGYAKIYSPPLVVTTEEDLSGVLVQIQDKIASLISEHYFNDPDAITTTTMEYPSSEEMFKDFANGDYDATSLSLYEGGYSASSPRRWDHLHTCAISSSILSFYVKKGANVNNAAELLEYIKKNGNGKKLIVANEALGDVAKEFLRDISIEFIYNPLEELFDKVADDESIIAGLPEFITPSELENGNPDASKKITQVRVEYATPLTIFIRADIEKGEKIVDDDTPVPDPENADDDSSDDDDNLNSMILYVCMATCSGIALIVIVFGVMIFTKRKAKIDYTLLDE